MWSAYQPDSRIGVCKQFKLAMFAHNLATLEWQSDCTLLGTFRGSFGNRWECLHDLCSELYVQSVSINTASKCSSRRVTYRFHLVSCRASRSPRISPHHLPQAQVVYGALTFLSFAFSGSPCSGSPCFLTFFPFFRSLSSASFTACSRDLILSSSASTISLH